MNVKIELSPSNVLVVNRVLSQRKVPFQFQDGTQLVDYHVLRKVGFALRSQQDECRKLRKMGDSNQMRDMDNIIEAAKMDIVRQMPTMGEAEKMGVVL